MTIHQFEIDIRLVNCLDIQLKKSTHEYRLVGRRNFRRVYVASVERNETLRDRISHSREREDSRQV